LGFSANHHDALISEPHELHKACRNACECLDDPSDAHTSGRQPACSSKVKVFLRVGHSTMCRHLSLSDCAALVVTTRRPRKMTRELATSSNWYTFSQNQESIVYLYSCKLSSLYLSIINTCKDTKLSRAWSPYALTCLSYMYKLHCQGPRRLDSTTANIISIATSPATCWLENAMVNVISATSLSWLNSYIASRPSHSGNIIDSMTR
jgi:hypothetical protein